MQPSLCSSRCVSGQPRPICGLRSARHDSDIITARTVAQYTASTSQTCLAHVSCGRRPCGGRARTRVVSRALFDPPPFQPEKLTVELADGTTTLEPAPPLSRKYTLTHNDITGSLRLTIGADYNQQQISGFYTRLLRDEVVAEWVRIGASGFALHVYCHVSGEERWLAPPLLRNYIFRREMPLVLDTLVYAERELLRQRPELAAAQVYVHFQSSVQELDTVEYWGVLGSRGTWPKGPTSILLRTIYAVVGWPPSLAAQPADLSVDQPAETQDVAAAVAAAAAALGIEPDELRQQQRRLKQQQQQQAELQQVQVQVHVERREAAAEGRSEAAAVGPSVRGGNGVGVEAEAALAAGRGSVVEAGEGPGRPTEVQVVVFAGVEAGGGVAGAAAAAGVAATASRATVGSGHIGGNGAYACSTEVQAAAERGPAGATACASADGAAGSNGVGALHGSVVVRALAVETVGQAVDTWDGGVLEPDGTDSENGAIVAGQTLCLSSNGAGLVGSNGHGGFAEDNCDALQQQQQPAVAAAVAVVDVQGQLLGGATPGVVCSGVDAACAGDVDTCTCQSRAAAPASAPGEAARVGRNGSSSSVSGNGNGSGNGAGVPLGGGIDSEADVAALQGLRPVPVAVRVAAASGAAGRPGHELVFASRASKRLS